MQCCTDNLITHVWYVIPYKEMSHDTVATSSPCAITSMTGKMAAVKTPMLLLHITITVSAGCQKKLSCILLIPHDQYMASNALEAIINRCIA